MVVDHFRLKQLFIEACDLPREAQIAFLNSRCNGNKELQDQLDRLLRNDSTTTAASATDCFGFKLIAGQGDAPLPASVGRYTPLRRIGEGGMGVVYLATQENPRRDVAVKMIRTGHLSQHLLQRFELEAHVLGRLQHSSIAQILEAGMHDDEFGSRPFFAMEYIDGVPLMEFIAKHKPSVRARLAMFTAICDAVHHAHQRGVIHRDLKPANILVTASGQPKILDFGVARATDSDLQLTTIETDIGKLIGTVPYMSPEQVSGRGSEIDTRSDIYSLGVILYELLAERLPYDLKQCSVMDAARVIGSEEPTPLSAINRNFRGDLSTIVSKALEKDPGCRYQSALHLAADIDRYLRDEPIIARPATTIYHVRKFAQRNRVLVIGISAVALALVLGIIGTTWGLVRAIEHAEIAKHESQRASDAEHESSTRAEQLEQVVIFQARQIARLDPNVLGARIQHAILDESKAELQHDNGDEPVEDASIQGLEELIRGVNFTSLALQWIEESAFQRSLDDIRTQLTDSNPVKPRLLNAVATSMRWRGLLQSAEAPQFEALRLSRQLLGEDDPLTLAAYLGTGRLLIERGRFHDAEPYMYKAMVGRQRVLGEDDSETLKAVNLYGYLLRRLGDYEGAEQYHRAALDGFQRTVAEDHHLMLFSLANLGSLLLEMRRLDEAEPLIQIALDGKRRKYGNDDRETILSTTDMALLREAQGMYVEAELLLRDSADRASLMFGPDHFISLQIQHFLGRVVEKQGRDAEAEQLYRACLESRRIVLGEVHPDTLATAKRLELLRQENDWHAEAEH